MMEKFPLLALKIVIKKLCLLLIFRIKSTEEILLDYLAMWAMCSEFDREVCCIAVDGVRVSMAWRYFCDMKLSVPDIKEQQKIVDA